MNHERVVKFYSRPQARWLALKERLGEKPYSTWGFWDEDVRSTSEAMARMVDEVARRARVTKASRVLDVGCGCGASSIDLARVAGEVVGIDVTPSSISHARKLGAPVRFEVMAAEELEFEDASFDAVIAIDCAAHFQTRAAFLGEAARVLRSGGRFVLLDAVEGYARSALDRALLSALRRAWHMPEENRCDARGLTRMVERAGFRDVVCANVTRRMLDGAIASMRARPFKEAHRAVFGLAGAWSWQLMLSAIARVKDRGLADFVLIEATR